jgi:membrane protein implicated in regulation of membrane protease activity
MTVPAVWWVLTLALIALELATGTIYALMIAIGFAVGAITAHLGAQEPTQMVLAALACVACVGGWYLVTPRRKKAGAADAQIDIGQHVMVPAWGDDCTAEVRYRGATWQVKPAADGPMVVGLHRIVDVKGNFLIVEFIGQPG